MLSALTLVIEVEAGIDGNHDQIDDVQNHDDVLAVEDLVGDARNIAGHDGQQEGQALALGRLGLERLGDVHGPCGAKADQHAGFKNTHILFPL